MKSRRSAVTVDADEETKHQIVVQRGEVSDVDLQCVESHMRELLEQGFKVVVVSDATAAVKLPGSNTGHGPRGKAPSLINWSDHLTSTLNTRKPG